MAYKIIKADWSGYCNDYIKEIICDADADFENLPKCCTGSSAVSVASGAVRVVNASGEWANFGG